MNNSNNHDNNDNNNDDNDDILSFVRYLSLVVAAEIVIVISNSNSNIINNY